MTSLRIWILLIVTAAATAACGSGSVGGQGTPGAIDAGVDASDPSKGPKPDASAGCGLRTCSSAGATCGPIGDGCGEVIQCGDCPSGQSCGGAGTPSQCGGTPTCVKRTCEQVGANCGPIADGCGGTIECGRCDVAGETCGGAGTANVCGKGGTGVCKPQTCADVGATCGAIGDGCGGSIPSCGTCADPTICGGDGRPSVCGGGTSGGPCTGLCQQQQTCTGGGTTSVSGTVFTPKGDLPLYNVTVYVPNAPLDPIVTGATCDRCDTPLSGSPLVTTTTDAEGKFTLRNMPVGANIPLVIQAGKWRRKVTIPNVPACVNTALGADMTHLPRKQREFGVAENNIPKIALTTGDADALECLLRKIGIADSEFTPQAGAGRVNLYAGDGGTDRYSNALGGAQFSPARDLWNTAASLKRYDIVALSCEGDGDNTGSANRGRNALASMKSFLDVGGRVFASHWHHAWVEHGGRALSSVATFNHHSTDPTSPWKVSVVTTFPKGRAFSDWLFNVRASTVRSELSISDPKHSIEAVNASAATAWILGRSGGSSAVPFLSFNTPVEAAEADKCGRMVITDIHVSTGDATTGDSSHFSYRFPTNGCTSTNLLPEEKALIFQLFDLASCITTDVPTCTKRTCAQAGANCGPVADGCGGLMQCGPCDKPGETCGGGGSPSVCGAGCTPRTCEQQHIECGPAGDGCGGIIQCDECEAPETCGGGGVPSTCGNGSCLPVTCEQAGANCGPIADGCGGIVQCGECVDPDTCGGSGTANVCGNVPVD